MRLVSGPCSETQALAASDRVNQGRVRMEAAPSTYPDVRRRVPPPPKNSDLEFFAGEVGRAVPPSTHAQHSRSRAVCAFDFESSIGRRRNTPRAGEAWL